MKRSVLSGLCAALILCGGLVCASGQKPPSSGAPVPDLSKINDPAYMAKYQKQLREWAEKSFKKSQEEQLKRLKSLNVSETATRLEAYQAYQMITLPPLSLPSEYCDLWHEKLGPVFPPSPKIDGMFFGAAPPTPADDRLERPDSSVTAEGLARLMRANPAKARAESKQALDALDKNEGFMIGPEMLIKTIAALERVVTACQRAGNMPDIERQTRIRLGRLYIAAGDAENALVVYTPILQHDPDFAPGLIVRAEAKRLAGKYAGAEADYRRALALLPHTPANVFLRCGALVELSHLQTRGGNTTGAAKAVRQAQAEAAQWNNARSAHEALIARGDLETAQGRYGVGEKIYKQALIEIHAPVEGLLLRGALLGLMRCTANQGHPAEAALFGKTALGAFAYTSLSRSQALRDPGADEAARQKQLLEARQLHRFLRTREADFRFLTDTLLEQGRMAETVELVDFFKEEETLDTGSAVKRSAPRLETELKPFWDRLAALYTRYFQKNPALAAPEKAGVEQQIMQEKTRLAAFVRPYAEAERQQDAQIVDALENDETRGKNIGMGTLTPTPREKEDAEKLYTMMMRVLMTDTMRRTTSRMLNLYPKVPEAQQSERQKKSEEQFKRPLRDNTPEDWETFFQGVRQHCMGAPDGLPATASTRRMQNALRELGHHSAALYTLLNDTHLHLILVTPNGIYAHTAQVSRVNVEKDLKQFLQALRYPNLDPRPAGRKLYELLVAPLEKELRQAGVETLMWSLDGKLRYIPVAALWNGGRYLLQDYACSLFTPASYSRLTRAPEPTWTLLGMGTSQAHGGFQALPGVRAELSSIVQTDATRGILKGAILLDSQFTLKAMLEALRHNYQALHIASHFALIPGDPIHSGLLLGDGSLLTLRDMARLPDNLFANVNMLALSACQTAADGDGDGREFENFAVIAQRKGAESILGALWPLSDESASLMMPAFYRARENGTTKTDALRQVQLALLTGDMPDAAAQKSARAQRAEVANASAEPLSPAFTPDPNAPLAHPFYWASFVLVGNWR